MLIFRLSQELNSNEIEQWKSLQLKTIGTEVHADRALSYCLSRDALRECLRHQGIDLEISQLIVMDNNKVGMADSYTLSLSHTKKWGAAILGSRLEYLGLGIDVELKDRAIKSGVLNRILHAQDEALAPLFIWCIKEAAFKTLMNSQKISHPVEFSSIQVSANGWTHSDTSSEGSYQIIEHPELVIALSWIKI